MYRTLVAPDTLRERLDDPLWRVVDCRFRLDQPDEGRTLYLTSHVPGAVYADLDRDLAAPPRPDEGRHPLPDLERFRATLGRWGIGEGVQVVCYDDSGGALAARLWWMLRYLGHESVALLDGGWQAWLARDYPTASGEESVRAATFHGEPRPEMVASLDEVARLVEAGEGERLIDARDERRYRGEIEPIDPVAGHIPGARNRPYARNLDDAGRLREPSVLADEFRATLGERAPGDAIVYCGSGVSACHNLLAMEHAGLGGARLFIPSWSGWSANPDRPVGRVESGE